MLPSSNSNNLLSFRGLWKGLVPPKIEVFCWMAILDKINMRKGLARRGIIAIGLMSWCLSLLIMLWTSWSQRRVSPNGLIPRFLDLKSPDPPFLKWNVDASVPGSSGCADIGGVLRDAEGIVLGMFSVPIGVKESNEEELIVVIKALEVSSSSSNLTGHSFIIEYDSHGCSIGLLDHV